MNIYLIGYRCTGKTSVGRMLAKKLDWRFVDTDQYIVEKAGMPVSRIVADRGWACFRKKEKQALAEINSYERLVIATGGGIILDPDNRGLLKDKHNFVVWLQAGPETITNRMENDAQTEALRPALTEASLVREIDETLAERMPYYESTADITVNTDPLSVIKICDHILEALRKRCINLTQ